MKYSSDNRNFILIFVIRIFKSSQECLSLCQQKAFDVIFFVPCRFCFAIIVRTLIDVIHSWSLSVYSFNCCSVYPKTYVHICRKQLCDMNTTVTTLISSKIINCSISEAVRLIIGMHNLWLNHGLAVHQVLGAHMWNDVWTWNILHHPADGSVFHVDVMAIHFQTKNFSHENIQLTDFEVKNQSLFISLL